MLKVSTFLGETESGPQVIPLFGPADSHFEKVASQGLRPEVLKYVDGLRPKNDSQYVLVNAMGASEYYSSNVNGDHFPETGLIHRPDKWLGDPLLDKHAARNWPYGFPTFYNAHPYSHHRNKDPKRAYGDVELAIWNDYMKRVELVTRIDKDKCHRFGGVGVWDRLQAGQYVDVSMGTKVPWDLCSICADWKLYMEALNTFNPKKHRHPGIAVLEFHKKRKAKNGVGIRGLSVTRKDYCEHGRSSMNQILPDGRKVFVYNYFPRFFDISFVFIGADRIAKVMVYLSKAMGSITLPSALVAENMGLVDSDASVKIASAESKFIERLKTSAEKSALDKEITPNLPPGKAVAVLSKTEPDMPDELMRALKAVSLARALSTLTGLGMVLKPHEFEEVAGEDTAEMSERNFMPSLARKLAPMMSMRSGLGPHIEHRIIMLSGFPKRESKCVSSLSSKSLRKMGAAYSSYRNGVMDLVANTQNLLESAAKPDDVLHKLSSASVEELFTPLAFEYLNNAFMSKEAFGGSLRGVVKTTPGSSRRAEGTSP